VIASNLKVNNLCRPGARTNFLFPAVLPGVYSYVLRHPVAFKFRQMQFNASSSGKSEVLGINFVDHAHNILRRNVLFAGNGLSYFDDLGLFLNLKPVFGY